MPVSTQYASTSFRSGVPFVSKPSSSYSTSSLSRGSRSSYEITGHRISPSSRDSSYTRESNYANRENNAYLSSPVRESYVVPSRENYVTSSSSSNYVTNNRSENGSTLRILSIPILIIKINFFILFILILNIQ